MHYAQKHSPRQRIFPEVSPTHNSRSWCVLIWVTFDLHITFSLLQMENRLTLASKWNAKEHTASNHVYRLECICFGFTILFSILFTNYFIHIVVLDSVQCPLSRAQFCILLMTFNMPVGHWTMALFAFILLSIEFYW